MQEERAGRGTVQIPDFSGLRPARLEFEQRHNSRYRYSRLHGQTLLGALEAPGYRLRFPAQEAPPTVPLRKPEAGRYHLVQAKASAPAGAGRPTTKARPLSPEVTNRIAGAEAAKTSAFRIDG